MKINFRSSLVMYSAYNSRVFGFEPIGEAVPASIDRRRPCGALHGYRSWLFENKDSEQWCFDVLRKLQDTDGDKHEAPESGNFG